MSTPANAGPHMPRAHDADCLIVGGGPAGLTAAIYLARFHMSVIVVEDGASRASLIPLTRNHAGYPDGISGANLLARMREQAERYGVRFRRATATALERDESGFEAKTSDGALRARAVLLATGVVNRRPEGVDDETHMRALAAGLLRYCPVCDAFEATDQRIAVLGTGDHGFAEACFLRSYSAQVTLAAPPGGHDLSDERRAELAEAGIALAGPCTQLRFGESEVSLRIDGAWHSFDTLYPALGSHIRSELAAQVGASLSGEGCLLVDAHQRTNIPGLFAAGDVILGLDQISHAMGQGGVAATTMRNDLAALAPLRR